MPELPEVETVVRDLRPLLVGTTILSVRTGRKRLRRAWAVEWSTACAKRQVVALRRRGKWIIAELDHGVLLIHLGMTGQLTAGAADRPVESHTHVFFELANGQQLRFRDIRRFGSIDRFETAVAVDVFLSERLGPEPFEISTAELRETLTRSRRCLKAMLLDQTVIAGVGNIYADESLFMARLRPHAIGRNVNKNDVERLRRAIVKVLTFAIEKRGSTIRNYVGGSGLEGGFQDEFRVYGRTGKPCRRCRTVIVRCVLAGRATHYCPKCQCG